MIDPLLRKRTPLKRSAWAARLIALVVLLCLPVQVLAQTFPDKPPESDFFVDTAGLIAEAEAKQINAIAAELLKDEQIAMYVVTIRSLAEFEAAGMGIERYAYALFDEWGIGSQDRNNGMLLLVSRGDRKARIELGADWNREHDTAATSIMDTLIVPKFKNGDYSVGILEGVGGMAAMARGLDLPKPSSPWWVIPLMLLVVVGLVVLVVNLFRSGRKGWAWAVIVAVGIGLFMMMRSAANNSGSGGGFGGGSGGGGGATGSW